MTQEAEQATESNQAETTSGYTPPATQDDLNKIIDARLQRERAKFADYDDLKGKAEKFDEAEAAKQSVTDRLTGERDAERTARQKAETDLLRLTVAQEKGLTPAQAKRLTGATREELEADADELRETFPTAASTDDTAQAVATSLDLGNSGTTTTAAGDPAADFAKFLKGQLA